MKMDKIANSKNDEFYTPLYAVKPIEKYLKRQSKIWCPFDKKESLFVRYLTSKGHDVLSTHIENGEDFFEIYNSDISDWCDYVISNPPYSLKTEVLECLFEIEKPFGMLLGVVGLFESQKRFELFKSNEFEVMYMNRRVSYMRDYESGTTAMNPPFSSIYLTSCILPEKIMFEEIDKKEILEEQTK